MSERSRAPARIAAILALIVATVALLMIISSAQDPTSGGAQSEATEKRADDQRRPRRAVYVVKEGDTLLGIAAKTGVNIDRLQTLNPEIDPQVLRAGQRIKLR